MEYIKSIELAAPAERAYSEWYQLHLLPEFMSGVERVEWVDDRRTRWLVSLLTILREFDACELDTAGNRIRWTTESGCQHHGEVRFDASGPRSSRLTLWLVFTPRGVGERVAVTSGLLGRRLSKVLGEFKEHLETVGVSAHDPHEELVAEELPTPSKLIGRLTGQCYRRDHRRS